MAEQNKNTEGTDPSQIGVDAIGDGLEQEISNAITLTRPQEPATNSGTASKEEVNRVIKTLVTMKKLPLTQQNFNKAYTSTCHLCQQGATSPKYAENARIIMYGIDLRVGELRQACITHKTTVRKLARALQNDIVKLATTRMMEGNLSKLYKLENPNYNRQDLIWVSDFQTFNDNTAMPDHVRTWLLENYRNRFRPNSKVRNADDMQD